MKKNRELSIFAIIGVSCLLAGFFLVSALASVITLPLNDLAARYSRMVFNPQAQLKNLKLISLRIDDKSLGAIPSRWPWKRSYYAELVKILDEEKVKVIGFDVQFLAPSESPEADAEFAQALSSVRNSRVILGYTIENLYQDGDAPGAKAKVVHLPFKDFATAAYAVGLLNTPLEKDQVIRRAHAYSVVDGVAHYSLSVQMASAYLDRSAEDIVSVLHPVSRHGNNALFINYILAETDFKTPEEAAQTGSSLLKLSYIDVLRNLPALKRRLGQDFLEGSIVLINPEAEIIHDSHLTPIDPAKVPGGNIHLNFIANLITGKTMVSFEAAALLLSALSCAVLISILLYFGFMHGLLLTLAVLLVNFWLAVVLLRAGIVIDFGRIVTTCLFIFVAGSIYKYSVFIAQLFKIKDKATLDPIRKIYTLRYFYYRLELEMRKFYLQKQRYFIFIYLDSFRAETEGQPLDAIKELWQQIHPLLFVKDSFWAMYSPEELVGMVVLPKNAVPQVAAGLRNSLAALFQEKGLGAVTVRVGFARCRKEFPLREQLYVCCRQLRDMRQEVKEFTDDFLSRSLRSASISSADSAKFLDSLDADIEEKNRELMVLVENLNKEFNKSKEMFFQVITALVNALEARDPYTEGHSQRVANFALAIADKLGWNKEEKEKLRKAALLHDLGKIGIPDGILHKKDRLSDEEFDFIKKHEIIAVRILEPIKEIAEILPWILYHHERWDGKGYPHGLGGNSIPEASQILSICDVFDALTSGRDYKAALKIDESLHEIVKSKGAQFNPELVDIFVSVINDLQPRSRE